MGYFREALEMTLIEGCNEIIHQFQALSRKPKLPRKDFYFIRHGQTDANALDTKYIDYDLPLNAKGREQALFARKAIMEIPFKTVCFSPILRAKETKEIITESLSVDQHEITGLRECDVNVWAKMIQLEKGRGYDVCKDVEGFLSNAINGLNISIKKDSPTLIVAHGGIHWALCYYLNIDAHPWKIGNCELVHFRPVGEFSWEAELLS